MNVLFKCDKSDSIGLGHYTRCKALAQSFKKKKIKCFFLGLKPGIIKKNKIGKISQEKDLEYTKKFIKYKKIQLVIKDNYSLGYNWEKKISEKVFLTVIDDFKNSKHYCDIYINYHYNWFKKKYFKNLKKKNCKKLIGPKFTILQNLNIKKKKFKKKTIFIYMGGADKNMFMYRLAKIFINEKFKKFIKIFLLNNNHIKNKKLIKFLNKIDNKKIIKNKIRNFHQYLASSDLSISPAGITMIEQVALNTNNLIIGQNSQQNQIANSLRKTGIINYSNNLKKINFNYIQQLLKKKRVQYRIINPQGKNLILKKIIENFR